MVNSITLYRILAAPFLVLLIINYRLDWFKWLLALSFFTDAIDGYLARRYKVASILGAKLDSIGDDLTIVAGIAGMVVFKPEFLKHAMPYMILLLALFVIQTILALVRYGKVTSFHTYAAKIAAILQGVFLILLFFLDDPLYLLFYATVIVTGIDLLEEIVLVLMLPKWQANVKGLWSIMKRTKQ
jgi:CDP-diacylglycerol--glycerol-3-phosphate 3-phosphatidyltransferase